MIEKSLLESKIKEQGILSVEINNLFEFEDKFIKLENENIDSLITFAKSNDIKSIFYYYTYYDKDDYIIKDENNCMPSVNAENAAICFSNCLISISEPSLNDSK